MALGTLLGRVTFRENIRIRSRELWECYTDLRDDSCGRLEDILSGYRHKRAKLPYLHWQSHPRTERSIATNTMGSEMFMGAHVSARGGPMPV